MQEEELHTTLVKAQQAILNYAISVIHEGLHGKVTIDELIALFPDHIPASSISRATARRKQQHCKKR